MPSQKPKHHKTVKVHAPARLHLGFMDPDGTLGRRFGSVGLAISEPATELVIATSDTTAVSGPESDRITKLLAKYCSAFEIDDQFHVESVSAIPAHAGLGSGTQLALAVGAGLRASLGQTYDAEILGQLVDRGARSAIGISAFDRGGFVVDGGKTDADRPPPVIAEAPIPSDWRIILALDATAQGIHGKREHEAFAELQPLSRETAAQLCHLTTMQMLPALHEENLTAFGEAVTEMQAVIGRYFAPVQGGSAFSSPRVQDVIAKLGQHGAVGLGQSSWGPTGFAFTADPDAAERLYATLVEEAKASGVELVVVSGRNTGAQISVK